MKPGKTLEELAREIVRVDKAKQDYVVPAQQLESTGCGLRFGTASYPLNNLAHSQLAEYVEIPGPYYRRMKDQDPVLLAANVNTWLGRKDQKEKRLVRTLDGDVRAFLSNGYGFRENSALAEVFLPVLSRARENLEVMSSEITQKKLYIKVVDRRLEAQIDVERGGRQVGDIVRGGISIGNSEVGVGATYVNLFVYILSCRNGMTREHSIRSIHSGKRLGADGEDISFLSREAIAADQRAFQLRMRDALEFAFDEKKFYDEVNRFQNAAENTIKPSEAEQLVENVTDKLGITKTEGKSVLERMLDAGDFSQWGLSMAVTNLANDTDDYDRICELEAIGGKVIDLNPGEFQAAAKKVKK
jgi:hypothetical protein